MKTMIIASLVLLAVSVGLGIWLGVAGTPYNAVLATVHKLASVTLAVLCVIIFVNATRSAGMMTWDIVLAVVFVVSLAALLATGGIVSAKQPTAFLRIVHAASAGILSLSAGWKLIALLVA